MLEMKKNLIEKMITLLEQKADVTWPAMRSTVVYKRLCKTMTKSEENLTYVDRTNVRNDLRTLCLCAGVDYYHLLKQVHETH